MSNTDKCEFKQVRDEKYGLHKQFYSPTLRLTITLCEPDEDSCSVFNYMSLVNEEKRNRRREKERRFENCSIEENDDGDGEMKKLALHFEEKYGTPTIKKKKKKKPPTFYNYSELASGYDENDSFIDNSEAFDEALPDEMETFHGGYYVNCGQLEFKKIETLDDNSDLEEHKSGKKKNCVFKNDDSNNNRESSRPEYNVESDIEDVGCIVKKLPEENESKETENESDKSNTTDTTKQSDKLIFDKSKRNYDNVYSVNGNVLKRKKKKYKKHRSVESTVHDDFFSKPKKKALTVKLLLEEKRIIESNTENNDSSVKISENFHNSINDIIESVVNAARNQSEDSRDSISSSSETKSIDSRTSYETEKESHAEETEIHESIRNDSTFPNISKMQIKTDSGLSSEMLDTDLLKNSSQNLNSTSRTIFNPHIDSRLFRLETEKPAPIGNTSVVSEKKLNISIPNNNTIITVATTTTTVTSTTTSTSNNYNLLTNSTTLQTLSVQYTSQSDVYSTASFCSDTTVISAAALPSQNTNLPLSMNTLSPVMITTNSQYASNHVYSKSNSPSKKQITLLSSVTSQNSNNSLSSGQFTDNKKTNDIINLNFSDTYKIDSCNSTSKIKKEHHLLNHISQYNKHYSHKNEKKKRVTNIKKECISDRNCVNLNCFSTNINNNYNSDSGNNGVVNSNFEKTNSGKSDGALDLSPSKIFNQDEIKFDSSFNVRSDTNSVLVSNITAKDHNYWSSRKKETENTSKQDLKISCQPVLENFNCYIYPNSKVAHISRKHRILQESIKSALCETENSHLLEETKTLEDINSVDPQEIFYKGNELEKVETVTTLKNYEEKLTVHEENQMLEETAAATDILSKIINDTLQDSNPNFLRQLTEKKEIKTRSEIKSAETLLKCKTEMQLHLPVKESDTILLNKPICSSNSERKTTLNNHAEMEAAEVINDLLVLNQIGGHSISRRMDYQDTNRYIDNKNTNELNLTNGSILNQSSHPSADVVKSSIPRMNLSGFQDEFFKHIFKMDRSNS